MLPSTAIAEDDVKREVEMLTECPNLIEDDGVEFCRLTLDDWKKVLATNAVLTNKTRLLHYEGIRSQELENQKTALQNSLEAMANSQKILADRVDKVTADLIATDKKYQNERVKPRLGSPLAWTITAAAVALTTGFVVKDALD